MHLFHDASNILAAEQTPSLYSKCRHNALKYTLQRWVNTSEHRQASSVWSAQFTLGFAWSTGTFYDLRWLQFSTRCLSIGRSKWRSPWQTTDVVFLSFVVSGGQTSWSDREDQRKGQWRNRQNYHSKERSAAEVNHRKERIQSSWWTRFLFQHQYRTGKNSSKATTRKKNNLATQNDPSPDRHWPLCGNWRDQSDYPIVLERKKSIRYEG